MNVKKHTTIDVNIEKLAFGGRGIGFYENNRKKMPIFVSGTAPRDFASVKITKIKSMYLEGDLVSIVKPSSMRIQPSCSHFGICGGCTWQFLDYENQLRYKEEHVKETLTHIGRIDKYELLPIIGSKEPFYYRNRLDFSFGINEKALLTLGFHLPKRFQDILSLNHCYLLSKESDLIRNKTIEFCIKNSLSLYESRKNKGLLRSLSIREGKNTGLIMINLITSRENFLFEDEFCKQMLELNAEFKDKKISSIYRTMITVAHGRPTVSEEKLLYGDAFLQEKMTIKGITMNFHIRPNSFFQTNTRQAEGLYAEIMQFADLHGAEIVYDLYCGTGTIGILTARVAKKVYGIENNETAIADARENARLNEVSNIEFLCMDAYKGFKSIDEKPNLAIADPPRSGLTAKLIELIIENQIPRLIYVSCNLATFARDAKLLSEGGYSLTHVRPVDMFPQTPHIEVVGEFVIQNAKIKNQN